MAASTQEVLTPIPAADKPPVPVIRKGGRPTYAESLAAERRIYESCLEVHDLPPIFHYWSHRHLRQKLQPYGFGAISDLFKTFLERQCRGGLNGPKHFLSLGSGNCDLELELAGYLRTAGCGDFIIECVDLNPAMLARGRESATAAGLSPYVKFTTSDLNQWQPARDYHAVMANQSLHHVVNLEGLFADTKKSLLPGGCFVISDMIGRNGHQRWPEAMAIVQEFWRKLPPSYRFNRKFGAYQELFQDWDCSVEGFEGVRSQDILPLLLRDFHFELFLPFGNVIDPFVDRSFGFNFDADAEWDRNFIDEVHARDEAEIASGRIKPTHMLAVVRSEPPKAPPVIFEHLTPAFCLRRPEETAPAALQAPAVLPEGGAYDWRSWSTDLRPELAAIARHFAEARRTAEYYGSEVIRLEGELLDRTHWALALDRDVAAWRTLLVQLNEELEERTLWALRLDAESGERTEWALRLNRQLDERTTWARQLVRERDQATQRALFLERELEKTKGLSGAVTMLKRWLKALPRYLVCLLKALGTRALRSGERVRSGAA